MWVEECDPQDFWVFLLLSFPWQSAVKQRTPCCYFLPGELVRFLCRVNLSEWKQLLKAADSGASWPGFCLCSLGIGAILGLGGNLLIPEQACWFQVDCDELRFAASPHSKQGFVSCMQIRTLQPCSEILLLDSSLCDLEDCGLMILKLLVAWAISSPQPKLLTAVLASPSCSWGCPGIHIRELLNKEGFPSCGVDTGFRLGETLFPSRLQRNLWIRLVLIHPNAATCWLIYLCNTGNVWALSFVVLLILVFLPKLEGLGYNTARRLATSWILCFPCLVVQEAERLAELLKHSWLWLWFNQSC